MNQARWAVGLLLISAALLGYELLLMRLLALAYWGHFAGMVISIAMLGIASSGLFLFFARARIERAPERYFAVSAGVFGVVAPLAFLLSQQLPFTPFLLTWSAQEYGLLAARSVLFFVPFFAAGLAIGTGFAARVLPPGRLYFWNMLGSGLPALPLLFAMNFTHPMRLLAIVAVIAMAAAMLAFRSHLARLLWGGAAAAAVAAVIFTPFRYSEYKDLPKTLLLPEAKVVAERYGWDGVVQIVDSPHTRYLPGLSLNFAGTLPPSQLVFTDAGAMTLAFTPAEALANPDFLRMTPEAFSFLLTNSPRVLHLYGSTADLLRSQSFGASAVRAIDDSGTRVAAVRSIMSSAADGGANFEELIVRGDARQVLEQQTAALDVIAISLLGAHGTSTAGAASLDPSFLLTLEGFSRVYEGLSSTGHAVLSTWVENPPKSGVRLISLWIETLRSKRIENAARHLIAIRSWSTLTIFVGREPFPPAAIASLKQFCEEHSFDLVWYEGIDPAETNQINVLPEDEYYAAFAALLGPNRRDFVAASPFALEPPDNDRPFFNQHFRWAAVPQWMSSMGMTWLPFVEWGYILHVATFVVVTLLGVLLLILPCIATRGRPAARTALLFFMLGLAYMFVQIWAIYKLSQLIAHPLLAASLVLSAMLAASGAGAALLVRDTNHRSRRTMLFLCASLAAAITLFPLLLQWFYPQPMWVRGAVAVAWLIVPAFFMGFPFPYSLSQLTRHGDIPWALALNGFGSVLGSLLATLVAVHFGLFALAVSAVVLYAAVALVSTKCPAVR